MVVHLGRIRITQDGPGVNWTGFRVAKYVDDETYQLLVPSWSEFAKSDPAYQSELGPLFTYSQVGAGWPAYALSCAEACPLEFTDGVHLIGGFQLPRSMESMRLSGPVPLLPIWPGFAINTIFYAAILWLLFAAPFKVRRWRRTRLGLCPACAYPVGESETCTECGRRRVSEPRP